MSIAEIPKEWTFENRYVAAGFDAHVREQLPWYDLVTGAITHIARHYIPEGGLVYDIGASTGNLGKALAPSLKARKARLVAIESSKAMCDAYDGGGELVRIDATRYDFEPYDLGICYLTLMFLPPEKQAEFVVKLRSRIKGGGALIIVDKVLPGKGYESVVFSRLALAGKVAAGVDAQSIIAKELSLIGAQRPIDPEILGDDAIEWFRFGDFAGWVITG